MNIELKRIEVKNPFGDKRKKRNYAAPPSSKDKYITAHYYIAEKYTLFVADSEGTIHVWKPKYDFKSELLSSKMKSHLGPIFKFLYLEDLGPGMLLSASADRTIKMWDVWDRDLSQRVVQTMVGHGGSVLDMAYNQGILVSCSTDRTYRVWMSDANRSFMLYPYFVCVQTLQLPGTSPCTVACMASSTLVSSIFIGDDKGRIHPIDKNPLFSHADRRELREDDMEIFNEKQSRAPLAIHDLSISHMYIAQAESYLCTLSFDQTAQIYEANSGNGVFGIQNPSRYIHLHPPYSLAL